MKIPFYYRQVYEIVEQIPPGSVTSYGAIADFLALGSARMVGYALRNCTKLDIHIPAHRVLNSKGELSGRMAFNPPSLMQELLEDEGLQIMDDKLVNFKQFFLHPENFNI